MKKRAFGAIFLLWMTGCSSPSQHITPSTPSTRTAPAALVGEPISSLDAILTSGTTLLVQDVSVAVGRSPHYTDAQQDTDKWMIVAACSSGEAVEDSGEVMVAVVPSDAEVEKNREKLRRKFSDAVDCSANHTSPPGR